MPRRSERDHASSRRLALEPAFTASSRKEVKPGLRYLLDKITIEFMKKSKIPKQEAEELIGKRWAAMSSDEQKWWNNLKKKEEEGEASGSRGDSTAGVSNNIQVEIQHFS